MPAGEIVHHSSRFFKPKQSDTDCHKFVSSAHDGKQLSDIYAAVVSEQIKAGCLLEVSEELFEIVVYGFYAYFSEHYYTLFKLLVCIRKQKETFSTTSVVFEVDQKIKGKK